MQSLILEYYILIDFRYRWRLQLDEFDKRDTKVTAIAHRSPAEMEICSAI